jgi:hypothetical protein
MFMCFTKWSSVINLDLFWKQVFSYTYKNFPLFVCGGGYIISLLMCDAHGEYQLSKWEKYLTMENAYKWFGINYILTTVCKCVCMRGGGRKYIISLLIYDVLGKHQLSKWEKYLTVENNLVYEWYMEY